MAGETVITVVGNLTGDPELRFTPSGAAVANFTVASTPRTFDRQSNEWKDGDTLFMRCSIWREAAENVAESLTKGMRVIVQGRLVQRSYETREGEKRTVVELQVEEIGPSLKLRHREGHPGPALGWRQLRWWRRFRRRRRFERRRRIQRFRRWPAEQRRPVGHGWPRVVGWCLVLGRAPVLVTAHPRQTLPGRAVPDDGTRPGRG